jgi:hypothetical protein
MLTTTTETKLRCAAYHEAGHAIMALRHLRLRGDVWVKDDGSGFTDCAGLMDWRVRGELQRSCDGDRRLSRLHLKGALHDLDVVLAGPVAEWIACGGTPLDFACEVDRAWDVDTVDLRRHDTDHDQVRIILWGLWYGITGEEPQPGNYYSRLEQIFQRRCEGVEAYLKRERIWTKVERVADRLISQKRVPVEELWLLKEDSP